MSILRIGNIPLHKWSSTMIHHAKIPRWPLKNKPMKCPTLWSSQRTSASRIDHIIHLLLELWSTGTTKSTSAISFRRPKHVPNVPEENTTMQTDPSISNWYVNTIGIARIRAWAALKRITFSLSRTMPFSTTSWKHGKRTKDFLASQSTCVFTLFSECDWVNQRRRRGIGRCERQEAIEQTRTLSSLLRYKCAEIHENRTNIHVSFSSMSLLYSSSTVRIHF